MDVVIDFPTAWHMTCVIFGGSSTFIDASARLKIAGKDLDELYITSAKTDYNGEDLPDRFDGGALFVAKNLGFTGLERNRYAGDLSL